MPLIHGRFIGFAIVSTKSQEPCGCIASLSSTRCCVAMDSRTLLQQSKPCALVVGELGIQSHFSSVTTTTRIRASSNYYYDERDRSSGNKKQAMASRSQHESIHSFAVGGNWREMRRFSSIYPYQKCSFSWQGIFFFRKL